MAIMTGETFAGDLEVCFNYLHLKFEYIYLNMYLYLIDLKFSLTEHSTLRCWPSSQGSSSSSVATLGLFVFLSFFFHKNERNEGLKMKSHFRIKKLLLHAYLSLLLNPSHC